MPQTRLTVELVPSTCWNSNLRSALREHDWERLQERTFDAAGHRCEICGAPGTESLRLHCHERWEYDDVHKVQSLRGLIALCPDCHEVKHIDLAQVKGRYHEALTHMAKVNGWSLSEADKYGQAELKLWSRRSEHDWLQDISWLDQFNIVPKPTAKSIDDAGTPE